MKRGRPLKNRVYLEPKLLVLSQFCERRMVSSMDRDDRVEWEEVKEMIDKMIANLGGGD